MYARRLKADALQFQLQATSRRKVVRQYLRLPLSWHRRHQTGTLIANANASTNTDVGATWSAIPPLPYAVGTVVLLLAAIVALFLTDLALALLGVLFMAAMLALNVTFSRRIAPRAADVQQLRAKLSAIAYESIDGALVVKSLCREAEETERVRASSVALRTAMTRVGRVQGSLRGGARRGLPGLATLGILAVGAWRLERGAVTVTEVLSMAFLFTVPAFPMVPISQVFAALPRSVVGWAAGRHGAAGGRRGAGTARPRPTVPRDRWRCAWTASASRTATSRRSCGTSASRCPPVVRSRSSDPQDRASRRPSHWP
ncbi:ABC transporter transmembrane domain-containing protein [Streptomyces sp. NPDC058335]|uniref:ABC transporter transmembrane domain-containing protein n=1 Tax=Streptomyces sp. NPDC058335 TaxID=3346451 RepID=UPI0036496FEC